MSDPIEVAARRLEAELRDHPVTPPHLMEHVSIRRVMEMALPILREVRQQALEEACEAICEWCEAGDDLHRDPSPENDWYHVDDDGEAFDCDAWMVRKLMEPAK